MGLLTVELSRADKNMLTKQHWLGRFVKENLTSTCVNVIAILLLGNILFIKAYIQQIYLHNLKTKIGISARLMLASWLTLVCIATAVANHQAFHPSPRPRLTAST